MMINHIHPVNFGDHRGLDTHWMVIGSPLDHLFKEVNIVFQVSGNEGIEFLGLFWGGSLHHGVDHLCS